MSEEPEAPRAVVQHRRRRWSSVWVVPAAALAVAGWLVWKNQVAKGPSARVSFETAESLKAGQTEVRCRSVKVGVVESVRLASDLGSVTTTLRLGPDYAELLTEGTRFWVVRPRLSGASISGLSTIVEGSYIELEPGEGPAAREFVGLEEPPVTSGNVPGLRLTLVATNAGSLAVGSPIYYRGFEVGQVERRELDITNRRVRFDVFIEDDYASLVREGTRFWNTSGIDVSAGADGLKLSTPSFQSMLLGGASFAVLKGAEGGPAATNGAVYELHGDADLAERSVFKPDYRVLLLFDQSVRGLSPGAPVEFRGIPIGRVAEISFKHSPVGDSRVPVMIEIDSSTLASAVENLTPGENVLAESVRRGLRASLSTGSLLTGALYVDLDFDPQAEPAELAIIGDHESIPTRSSGFARLQDQMNALLAKLEALPLDETLRKFGTAADEIAVTVKDLRGTLDEAEGALAEAKNLLGQDSTRNLSAELEATLRDLRTSVASLGPEGAVQGDLARTLDELRAALRSFKSLSDTVEEEPNSLIFGREGSGDPIPRARR